MKAIVLCLTLLFGNAFAGEKPPISTQKGANTTLTCPTKKWCRVQVSVSMTPGFLGNIGVTDTNGSGGSALIAAPFYQYNSLNETFTIDLKSGDTLLCSASAVPVNGAGANVQFVWRPYLTCLVSGVQIYKKYISVQALSGSTNVALNTYLSLASDFSFYSMEYYN